MPNLTYEELPSVHNVLIYSEELALPETGIDHALYDLRNEKLLLLGQEESPLIREYQLNYFHTKGLKPECVEYHNVDSISALGKELPFLIRSPGGFMAWALPACRWIWKCRSALHGR